MKAKFAPATLQMLILGLFHCCKGAFSTTGLCNSASAPLLWCLLLSMMDVSWLLEIFSCPACFSGSFGCVEEVIFTTLHSWILFSRVTRNFMVEWTPLWDFSRVEDSRSSYSSVVDSVTNRVVMTMHSNSDTTVWWLLRIECGKSGIIMSTDICLARRSTAISATWHRRGSRAVSRNPEASHPSQTVVQSDFSLAATKVQENVDETQNLNVACW